jgi:SAM-dependent methyltransferase
LADEQQSELRKFSALAEYLPFADQVFDRVLFATTLDHFVDPKAALRQAARVCRTGGEVDVWLGEKSVHAPPPVSSATWYNALERPEGADDVFHVKRLNATEFDSLLDGSGLQIAEHESHRVDPFRTNHFYRLVPR